MRFNSLFHSQIIKHVIKRSLTPGSVYKQALLRCVLRKDTLRLFPIWAKPSLIKDLQTEPKKVLCVGLVKQEQSAWFTRTNEPVNGIFAVFFVYIVSFRYLLFYLDKK